MKTVKTTVQVSEDELVWLGIFNSVNDAKNRIEASPEIFHEYQKEAAGKILDKMEDFVRDYDRFCEQLMPGITGKKIPGPGKDGPK